ncbi:MAG: substrate-binding domain-containing protein, partial [Pseudomonadota bacterium]
LGRIAAAGAAFVSRGDDSGTHRAEQSLWPVSPDGQWYKKAGSGMGATLNIAMGLGAYVLTDRASWLNFGNRPADMGIVFQGDPALFNPYGYLPVSAMRHRHVKADTARKVEHWLTGAKGQAAIAAYRINAQQVFFPNAR